MATGNGNPALSARDRHRVSELRAVSAHDGGENVGYGLRMRGVPKAEIAERVGQALALVKLAGYGQRKPRELSGGSSSAWRWHARW